MTLFALLIPTMLGYVVITMLLRHDHETGSLERLSFSFPLGMGFLTLQMFLLGLMRVPLTLGYTLVPIALEIAAFCILIVMKKIRPLPKPSFGLLQEFRSTKTGALKKSAITILSLWILLKTASLFIETGLRPIYAWDAWANWSAGAKLFYHMKSLMLDAPVGDFFARGAVLRIVTYPLHNPLMQTWISLWNGSFDEILVKFWSPIYLVAMSLCLYTIASRELSRLAGLALVVLFMSSPLMSYHGIEVYSDLTVGAYLFFASVSFLNAIRGRKGFWLLIGIFSAQALLTKEEALFYILPLLISAFVFTINTAEQVPVKRSILFSLFTPLLMTLPWYIFKIHYGLGLGAGSDRVNTHLSFYPNVIPAILSSLTSLDNFNVFLVFFPFLVLSGWRRSIEILHLLFAFACYVVFFAMLYLFTEYHVYIEQGTIINRNILTAYPILALLTTILLKYSQPQIETPPLSKKR